MRIVASSQDFECKKIFDNTTADIRNLSILL